MGETISLDDYTTLPGKSGATHSISLCIALHTQHATRNKHRKNQNYLVYFKVAPRQTISAAVLPKVRYRAYPFGLASFALIAISKLRLGILAEQGEGSKSSLTEQWPRGSALRVPHVCPEP